LATPGLSTLRRAWNGRRVGIPARWPLIEGRRPEGLDGRVRVRPWACCQGLEVEPQRRNRKMLLRGKIVLKPSLSGETLDAARNDLRQFFDQHTVEHFDGTVSIYLCDPADVRLLEEHFASLIVNVQPLP
jgi:hypothetical protein